MEWNKKRVRELSHRTGKSVRLGNPAGETTNATSVHYFPCELLSHPNKMASFAIVLDTRPVKKKKKKKKMLT